MIAYPFFVYWGIDKIPMQFIGWIFVAVLVLRSIVFKQKLKQWLPLICGVSICALLLTIYKDEIYLKLNPVIISFSMCFTFFITLFKPPSMIETFARLQHKDLPQRGVDYCRKVTIVWVLFLFANGLVSLYTAYYANMKQWTLYNGFIAYVLMGILFLVEFLYRTFVVKPNAVEHHE